jgi:hypothetical protein
VPETPLGAHLLEPRRSLKVGDEVTIRLMEVSTADPPIKRYRSDREAQESPFTDEELRNPAAPHD